MKIYITDLEAYNNGHLVGEWYQLPMSKDLLDKSIESVLKDGGIACGDSHFHEEYFITDYECEYMEIQEYSNLNKLNEIAQAMESIDEDGKKSIKFLLENNFVKDIFEYIEVYYNRQRMHSTNNNLSPVEFEESMLLNEMVA